MARLYSRAKGKSKSTKPIKKGKRSWVRYDKKELEQLIIKLVNQENTQSKIGLILRDTYGVPDVKVVLGKKLNKFLEENKLLDKLPEDLVNLIKKDISIMKHMGTNKKDMTAKRGLILTESKINRLVKYYKKNGKLNGGWKYDRDKAKLLIS
ncbi:MAG: 30S ribosomal protein S15 [Nanoarchaeota archaeon]|nr:30S ribosomal protein S15 [Nanoarchaeota archaeon]